MRRLALVAGFVSIVGSVLSGPPEVLAAHSCRIDRFAASDRYVQCRHKASRFNVFDDYQSALGKCLTKFLVAWPRLQDADDAQGGACASPTRFVDGGDGTVTDMLTGLQWEKKTDDNGVHDKDNLYSWSTSGTSADGTAFTSFLAMLDQSGSCFAGQCDWRMPTAAELQSIDPAPFGSCNVPCVDATVFGPVTLFPSWSATDAANATNAVYVTSVGAELTDEPKTQPWAVRAVRGGL
jgi:hypothetical protein